MKNNKGFTLVELLVVVAILAILAVAGMTMLNPVEIMKKSQDSGAKATASQVVSAYERAMLDDTSFASSLQDTNICAADDAQCKIDFLVDTAGELKSNAQKSTLYTNADYDVQFVFTNDELSVCFVPQSAQMKTEVDYDCDGTSGIATATDCVCVQ